MPHILLVDDDEFSAGFVCDVLTDRGGFEVTQVHTVTDALGEVTKTKFDLIIVDIMMPPGTSFNAIETAGGRKTGIALAREFRKRLPTSKILGYSSSPDPDVQTWFVTNKVGAFLEKTSDPSRLLREVRRMLIAGPEQLNVFIVHGRDHRTMLELKNYLQNRLAFKEPIILAEQPQHGRTLIEKFEHYAAYADIVFVLLTPDDFGYCKDAPATGQLRPRLNVVFECGFFMGYLRRQSGRVLFLYKGGAELNSDLSGIAYIDITNGIEAAGEEIRRELAL
jgi:CheY-like chemotaxis protein